MLIEAYGGNALSRAQSYRWFEKFQNVDFDVSKTMSVADQLKNLRMLNCKHYSMKMMAKRALEHLAEQLNVNQSPVSRRLVTSYVSFL
ncbi:hypothetical protein TNCV_4461201 [Trichonephila clavipes]|nr:hypothetical protein TNCV_4461201 [Trichonephila clavipes]